MNQKKEEIGAGNYSNGGVSRPSQGGTPLQWYYYWLRIIVYINIHPSKSITSTFVTFQIQESTKIGINFSISEVKSQFSLEPKVIKYSYITLRAQHKIEGNDRYWKTLITKLDTRLIDYNRKSKITIKFLEWNIADIILLKKSSRSIIYKKWLWIKSLSIVDNEERRLV